jgi:asparagine synthase (glutamine-hydrolysing)
LYHYVAFIWNCADRDACLGAAGLASDMERASPDWKRTFASTRMAVYTQPPRTADLREYFLPASHGVILGRLFPAELDELVPRWEPVITESQAARYLETAGRGFTEDYWGAYIALLTSPAQSRCVVLRDPSGKLPCYRLRHAHVDILFSDPADLSALPLPPLTFNWRYLAAFLYLDALQIRESALAEVTEVLAGESVEIRDCSARQHIAWDPRSVAGAGRRWSYEQAARKLRSVTQACIDAWTSVHPRVLHCLSGGLDSAIVLGCLAASPTGPAIVCINRYVEDPAGDERVYARRAAELARAPLIEVCVNQHTFAFDARMLALPRGAKPGFSQCGRLLQLEAVNPEVLRHEAAAVWKGQGGDHLFLKFSDIPSASDYLADLGWRWGFAGAARDSARLSAQPYVSVLRAALSSKYAPRATRPRSGERGMHFVRHDAVPRDLDRYLAHPWDLEAEGLPPGRQRQIHLLAEIVNRHRPLSRRELAYEHHPLLSQPIVEQCLKTPTYLHLCGGRHRALARNAFSDCVPQQIIQRESKGDTTSFVVDSIRRSEDFLCELLLDGVLTRERLIDRAQLEACLRDGQALMPGQLPPLLACIAAEIWARAWTSRANRA